LDTYHQNLHHHIANKKDAANGVVSVGYSTKLKASSISEGNDDSLVKLSAGRKT
jgi:hypothetical protein